MHKSAIGTKKVGGMRQRRNEEKLWGEECWMGKRG